MIETSFGYSQKEQKDDKNVQWHGRSSAEIFLHIVIHGCGHHSAHHFFECYLTSSSSTSAASRSRHGRDIHAGDWRQKSTLTADEAELVLLGGIDKHIISNSI